MASILDLIDISPQAFRTAPMQCRKVNARQWREAGEALAAGTLTLLAMWAHGATVNMALSNEKNGTLGILSFASRRGVFPSIGRLHAPAIRLERAIADLSGLKPEDAPDDRPWLDHGRWDITHPLGKAETRKGAPRPATDYPFLPVEGESLHQIPVGPVHAGIIEPGHFRFTAQGETVVRLEARLGYVHKGVEKLMEGGDAASGSTLAGRASGDSTVACQWAYAQAVEAALKVKVPKRALYLRAVMAELERLANHLGDFGAICNDASLAMMLAQAGVLREKVLRAADTAFGHRLMRDQIVPGGVARDMTGEDTAAIRALLADIGGRFPSLVALYDNTASLLDRTVTTGILKPELARQFGAGGFVGRASARDFDTERDLAYAPYNRLAFEVARRDGGDVDARVWIRIEEIRQSLALIEQCLNALPDGPVQIKLPKAGEPREGLGIVEGFRGDILVWLALDADGRIARCYLRDPSWFQWPLLEVAVEGNIVADFPLCNKSFNCSYSGHDL